MRTTIVLDDDLLDDARELTGITENAPLLRAALQTLIGVEAGRRLAALGGTDPTATLASSGGGIMRTTIVLDDDLLEQAQKYSGVQEKSALVRLALKRYVESEASRRLARLGGSQPDLVAPPRRRFGGA